MMEFPPWGFKPYLFPMTPVLPRPGTELRMRARPFTWELSLPAIKGARPRPFPVETAQRGYFRLGGVCKIKPLCGDDSPCPSATSHPSILLKGGVVLQLPALTRDQGDLTQEGSQLTLTLGKGADLEILWVDIPNLDHE